jgi:hypothetical protein
VLAAVRERVLGPQAVEDVEAFHEATQSFTAVDAVAVELVAGVSLPGADIDGHPTAHRAWRCLGDPDGVV